ncbi:MAG TPA: hypoxanthine phosphoribosyltransferase [Anaerolineae bacterium]|nr:hypoxanthine phosphoribosyltransferase [Anaerolineae bacterium]
MENDVGEVLITYEQIRQKTEELGRQITEDYEGKDLLLICVLKGGLMFLADLMREIQLPVETDFMAVSSYGDATESSGVVRILMDLDRNVQGRHVLIVEDIIDTGRTLNYIIDNLRTRGPASIKVCTLLNKPARRVLDIPLDYVGFTIPDRFVVGYGLDYGQIYRNLPFIGVLKPELYSKG